MCHFYVSYPNTSSCKFLFFCILDLLTHDISFIPIPVFLKSYVLKELEVFLGQMNWGGGGFKNELFWDELCAQYTCQHWHKKMCIDQ